MDKYNVSNVNNRILEVMTDLVYIRQKMAELIESPNEIVAQEIDEAFERLELDSSALRSSVVVSVKKVTGADVKDGEDFDVAPEDAGLRMN